jgi:hypothetical protein
MKLEVANAARSQLTSVRAELGRLIQQLADARGDLERAATPVRRLDAVLAELDRAEAELTALRATDEGELAAWLTAGAGGARPAASAATLAAEQRVGELIRDGGAAHSRLPALQNEVGRCSTIVASIAREQRRAI